MMTSEVIRMLQRHMAEHGDLGLEIQVEEPDSDMMLSIALPVEMDLHEDGQGSIAVLMAKARMVSVFWEDTYDPTA